MLCLITSFGNSGPFENYQLPLYLAVGVSIYITLGLALIVLPFVALFTNHTRRAIVIKHVLIALPSFIFVLLYEIKLRSFIRSHYRMVYEGKPLQWLTTILLNIPPGLLLGIAVALFAVTLFSTKKPLQIFFHIFLATIIFLIPPILLFPALGMP